MRKDYVKQCISSVSFLTSSSFVSQEERSHILHAANRMLNEIWKIEYKSYYNLPDKQSKTFWDTIHTELETEQHVYRFTAWYGESVNPPGKKGNVVLHVQPKRSVEILIFNLSIE